MNRFAKPGLAVDQLPSTNETDVGKALVVGEDGSPEWGSVDALPPVTSDDNGDVLTVVEGAWAKAAAPSGGGVVTIPVTQQYSSGVYYWVNANYTYQQIFDLIQAGTEVVIKEPNSMIGRVSQVSKNSQNNIYLTFVGLYSATVGGGIDGFVASGNSSTSSTLKLEFHRGLPVAPGPAAVLTEDNGNLIAASMTSTPGPSQQYYTEESVFMGEAKHWYSTVSYYLAPMSSTYNIVIKDDMTGDLYHLTSLTQPYTFTPYTP